MENNSFNITIATKDLIHALNFAGSIAEKRNVRPILGNVKLEAKGNSLTLTATAIDIAISLSIGAEVRNEGATTVNIVTFSEIIRKLSDHNVTLNFNHATEQLEVSGANFTSNFTTLPANEFPALDNITPTITFKTSAKGLLRILNHTEFAMSTEETRYNLNGIYLNLRSNNLLNATAIDGHRLATASEPIDFSKEFGIILPRKTVCELIKILKDSNYIDSEITIAHDNVRISIKIGNLIIISKLIDATFPDYTSLLPDSHNSKLTIHSKVLAEVADRVATITHDKFKAIKLILSSNKIEVSAFGETKGSANEVIVNLEDEQKFAYEGEEIIIGFNPRYLLDVLKTCEDQEIEILFNSSLEPLLIKPTNYSEDRYIIMPMKV